jgi:hypothetical protein
VNALNAVNAANADNERERRHLGRGGIVQAL